jgi:hypothetical protein
MRNVLAYAKDFGALIIHHLEEPTLAQNGVMNEGEVATRLGLPGIPREAETIMLERDLRLAELTGGRYHAGQISCRVSLDIIRAAKQRGLPITCGVSINHLTLNENDIGPYRTFFKMRPPLRSEDDRAAMVEGIASGDIDVIVSAHDPQDADGKRRPFAEAADGAIGVETLLFLRNIHRIRSCGLVTADVVLERTSATRGHASRRVCLSSGQALGRGDEEWFVWERQLRALGRPDQRVEIAFMVRAEIDSSRLVRRDTSPLVVFFPTQKETFLGFVLQGPYRTTPARDNVPEHDEWNQSLVRETASLLVEVLTDLRDDGLLTAEVLQALPLDAARFGPDTMFRALFESARAALGQEEMIPAADGGYRCARQLKLANGAGLRELLTPNLLGDLCGEEGRIAFVADSISEIQTPVLWRYLR